MMLRFAALLILLASPLLQAAPVVSQRPIDLDTGTGVLHGSLLLPVSDKPVPVVLIISGSGPTDRDGNNPQGGRNDSLRKLAMLLARHGIASVRYDKRGVATGLPLAPDERTLSVEGYVADAQAWARQLKADPHYGPLILLGHSEGALIATLAAPDAGAAAVISVAGSGRPLDQVIAEQLKGRLPPDLEQRSTQLLQRLKAGQYDGDVPAPLQVIFRPSVQPYLVSLLRQDPAAAFGRLKVPALIIQGRNDIQVGVADARALKAAKPDAQLVVVDGMNHVMRIVDNNLKAQVASYNNPNLPLADALGNALTGFIGKIH
ncbi:alpha/beta hydrolase [Pseudomonas eucalypticola]|uniref:Alpha/beta fold hydrolase n=1 Tax=Pseudomonas eucalypticola TaxID=2599595 RepID=A0A7D5H7M7_9PSED|nr:alpha/beta fold hydrolase [Pseudomonas eucalypticola]QKZ06149.1 alpha/beta fold hydrolase [Pseudomonas eucalypticola]